MARHSNDECLDIQTSNANYLMDRHSNVECGAATH